MRKYFATSALAGSLVFFAASAANATVITFNDFSSASGLSFLGSANVSNVPGVLQLTPAATFQGGVAYTTNPLALGPSASFSTEFQFRLNQRGGAGSADGFTFFVAANMTNPVKTGGTLAYSSSTPFGMAIEFDTYDNVGTLDVNGNHVAIDTKGFLSNLGSTAPYGQTNCATGNNAGCMSNGDIWTAGISYDGITKLLNVSVFDPAKGFAFQAINNYSIDIATLLGTNTAYLGFTGATGGGWEEQDILSWRLSNTAILPPKGVPEPLSLALFSAGLAGVAGLRRRKKV